MYVRNLFLFLDNLSSQIVPIYAVIIDTDTDTWSECDLFPAWLYMQSNFDWESVELLQLPSNISELHVVTLTRRQTVPKEMDRNAVSEVVLTSYTYVICIHIIHIMMFFL